MNRATFNGRLTKDPELRTTSNGKPFTIFDVAVPTRGNPNKKADFIRCQAWGKTAELISNYFHKGSQIGIDGRIDTGSYQKQDGSKAYYTQVVVNSIDFLDPKSENQQGSYQDERDYQPRPANVYPDDDLNDLFGIEDDDDLPF